MKFFASEFGNTLIKFCEKREYAEDIANGNIYIKKAAISENLRILIEGTHMMDVFVSKNTTKRYPLLLVMELQMFFKS